jgi:hypothetical protein
MRQSILLAVLGFIAGAALTSGTYTLLASDDGRQVAEAQITCHVGIESETGACERKAEEVVAEHCEQPDIDVVRLTTSKTSTNIIVTDKGVADDFWDDASYRETEVISEETTEYAC